MVTYVDGFVYVCICHQQSYRQDTYDDISIALEVIWNVVNIVNITQDQYLL